AVLVDLAVEVIVVMMRVVVMRGRVLVDQSVVVIEDVGAIRVVMMRREVTVQRDVQPRHELEPDDPEDRERERDAAPFHPPHDAMYEPLGSADQGCVVFCIWTVCPHIGS